VAEVATACFTGVLFGLLLALHLFDLLALIFNFLLLLLQLRLRLLIGVFLILHRVANRKAAYATHRTTDRGACSRMANGRADYGARAGAEHRADTRTLFTGRQGLAARASRDKCA